MAGRPVTLHGGPSGMMYGMIAFAVVSVVALGLFIFQLTKNKGAQAAADTANRQLSEFGKPPAYYKGEADARKTPIFAVVADDQRKLASLVTGNAEDMPPAMQRKAQDALERASKITDGAVEKNQSLVTALETLSRRYAEKAQEARASADEKATLQQDLAACTEGLRSQQEQFTAQVGELRTGLQRAQDEKISALQQKDAQLRELQSTLDATEAQLQTIKREGLKSLQDREIEIGRLTTLIGDLQKQVQALKPSTFDPSAILTSADGRVLRAIPGSDVVYVNLGAADKVKPGMGFEVYSQSRTPSEGLRGKASLEVVTVLEETSECRVMRREAGQPILEGDIVVNLAYERNRKPKFVVRGDFDLDYDGNIDFNGVEQISSLIRQWGGQVVPELDESVDYVVIGVAPSGPALEPGAGVSDVVRDQAQRKELERSQFRALIERAQKMFIPVITQNQFLFLTGYAGDSRVVQR